MSQEYNLFPYSDIPELLGLTAIVISPTDLCNRTCSFCPHSMGFPNLKNYMSIDLANKLASELQGYNWKGMVSVAGYGEPLLHPNIGDIIKAFTSRDISTRLITSGDRILNGRFKPEEIDDWELFSIKIDCYDGDEDVNKMNKILIDLKTTKTITTGPSELSNRAGYIWKEDIIKKSCYLPSTKSIVDWNGQVYICCEDWSKEKIFGNVNEQSFSSIWLSEKLHEVRMKLQKGIRSFSTCVGCNIRPTLLKNEKEEVVKLWRKANDATN